MTKISAFDELLGIDIDLDNDWFTIVDMSETGADRNKKIKPSEMIIALGMAPITASEAISAGHFVNIHASSGAKVRKANATDDTKPCDGYAPAAISSAAIGAVVAPGRVIAGLSGLTPGADYFLDTTGGAITATPPSTSGNLVQKVGKAVSATKLFFNPQPGITL